MDRYTALQVFRHVAEGGSFAAAGRRLGLSPAAVSKNVAQLEAHAGARLIQRTTRRMALTEAGRTYLAHVVRALDALADADHALCPTRTTASGLLRVSAPMSVGLMRLSRLVPAFLARHPALSLDLHLDDRRVDLVRDGFDLAIRASDRLDDSTLVARRLAALRHVLCAAPGYLARHGAPATPADLAAHPLVRFSLSGHADTWTFTRAGRTERVPVAGRYAVTSSLAVRDALLAGFGISLVPALYVEDDLAAGRLQPVLADWHTVATELYAVYPSRQHLAPKVRAFVDFAIEAFGGGAGEDEAEAPDGAVAA